MISKKILPNRTRRKRHGSNTEVTRVWVNALCFDGIQHQAARFSDRGDWSIGTERGDERCEDCACTGQQTLLRWVRRVLIGGEKETFRVRMEVPERARQLRVVNGRIKTDKHGAN